MEPKAKYRPLMLVCLAAMLALVLGIGVASGDTAPAAEEAPPAAAPARTELPGARTATSDTFRLPDGELQTQVYESPVNYRDASGN